MVLHQQLLLLQQINGAGPWMLQRMRMRVRMRMMLRGQRAGGSAHGDFGFGGTGRTHGWRAEHLGSLQHLVSFPRVSFQFVWFST